jgi:hypothetical protein
MLMKIVTYVVIAVLILTLGAAAAFYFTSYKPMTDDYARMKAGLPELDKAKAELIKIKEQEKREKAWLTPAIDVLNSTLTDEIKAGKAEVLTSGNRLIINIAEDSLYLPGSYTFSKESPGLRAKLITLLRKNEVKGKDMYIGNTTEAVPAQGRGRKKIPSKDARTLAADRSAALIRDFEKNGVDQDSLIAAAFSSKEPDFGVKLKARKTIIIIENPPAAQLVATKQDTAPTTKASMTVPVATQTQPKMIPIQPVQPKTN